MRVGLVVALTTVIAIQGVSSNYGLANTGFDNLYSSIYGLFGNGGNYYGNYRSSSSSSSSESYEYKKCEKCNRLKKFNPGQYEAGRLPDKTYAPIEAPVFTYFHHKGCKKAIITCPSTEYVSVLVAKVKDHEIPDPEKLFPDNIAPLAFGTRLSFVVKCDGENKKWKAQELLTNEWIKFTEVACLPIVNILFSGPIGKIKVTPDGAPTFSISSPSK